MNGRREILRAHYTRILRKAATWAGLVSLLGTMFVATPASALGTQMGARSVTPTTLKASATATYAYSFKPGTTGAVGSIKFELCTSPLESVGCTTPTGASNAGAGGITLGGQISGFTIGTGTPPAPTAQTIWITNGSTPSLTAGTLSTVSFTGIVNPSTNNAPFYARITTYSGTNGTGEVDFGGYALMTAQDLTISAAVQESLTFCVGDTVTSGCASTGTGTISLGTGSGCPIMSTSNICTGTAQFAVSTNAATGYTVTYDGSTFTGPSDTITEFGAAGATSAIGTKQFGLAGTAISGTGSGAWNATYNFGTNGSKYAFQNATVTTIASAAAATAENIFTVTYGANVSAITKPGQYTSTFNYVCTGLF